MIEKTLVIVKPDGVVRGLVGEVVKRIEKKGLKIVAMKMIWINKRLAEKQYEMHKGKPFYEGLIKYITSAPSVVMVVEGKEAIKVVRNLVGATNPREALPGSIRGDFAIGLPNNIVHASDSRKTAEREIRIYFNDNEIYDYRRCDEEWLGED